MHWQYERHFLLSVLLISLHLFDFALCAPYVASDVPAKLDYSIENLSSKDRGESLFSKLFANGNFMESVMSFFTQSFKQTPAHRNAPERVMSSRRQLDQPLPSSVETSFSIDEATARDLRDSKPLPFEQLMGKEWKSTLFGPSGLLTEIFNFVNDKRKHDLEKVQKPQSDLGPAGADFSKILDTLLFKSQNGNFDEPLPELPFIGICNRLSCADIYKAMDEFRKSEMFSNFQTAMSLIHDPKGWDIIGDLLANPDLIEQYVNGGNVQELLVKKPGGARPKAHSGGGDIRPGDGDLGIDFSSVVDGKSEVEEKVEHANKPMPEISESVDYYSSVVEGEEESGQNAGSSGIVTQVVEERIATTHRSLTTQVSTTRAAEFERTLPEISESIDEIPEEFETITVEETVPISAKAVVATNAQEKLKSGFQRRFVPVEQSTTIQPMRLKIAKVIATTATVRRLTTTSMPLPPVKSTTRKNFRKFNDYYSMYYDA